MWIICMISDGFNGLGDEHRSEVWVHNFSNLLFLFTDAESRVMNGKSAFSHSHYNCLWGNWCINDLQTCGFKTVQDDSCRGGGIPLVNLYLQIMMASLGDN